MVASAHRRANFERVCVSCSFYNHNGVSHRCTVGKDLVSGRAMPIDCYSARSVSGLCGPDGLRFSQAEAIEGNIEKIEDHKRKRA